ncbi:MAG: sigma-54-dependent Fis family transcriptional regulator [Ectothiorhodospiraceae bacterium]|nr:sigma-54-dependent Fis family transcriptional regulator [Ectothiorhodospiraceae bacterium]
MNKASVYFPQRLRRARQLFFERLSAPVELVEAPILRSWQRCLEQGRGESDAADMTPVARAAVTRLLDRNRVLIDAATPELERLAKVVEGAGCGVLLTDNRGFALLVLGSLQRRDALMRQAFRPGVELSERAIGTSAMSVAMVEQRPARVFGAEHYLAQNRVFHCVAAPIHDPGGELVGVVDITRDASTNATVALRLVTECARLIERRLFARLHCRMMLEFDWQAPGCSDAPASLLALGEDGEIIGANRQARMMLDLSDTSEAGYSDIFNGSFAELEQAARRGDECVALRLQSGFEYLARVGAPARARGAHLSTAFEAGAEPTAPRPPDFGDPGIEYELQLAARAYRAQLPILITGETGTGKEVASRFLHASGPAANGPFVALNCAAIPETLIEAELFGYVDGAFTGARKGGAKGKIASAEGGTLFLDEIGDMPLQLQARLLRVLENQEVVPVGGLVPQRVAFQLICATHRELDARCRENAFRTDLLYRIRGAQVRLPPLSRRPHLGALVDALVQDLGSARHYLTAAARDTLLAHTWPGNTRELRNVIRYAMAMSDDGRIDIQHLPAELRGQEPLCESPGAESVAGSLKELERVAIESALQAANGRVAEAARQLGISRATLYRRMKR